MSRGAILLAAGTEETLGALGVEVNHEAYVAITQMGGQGTFVDEDLGHDIEANPDLVTPKLAALREYQF
jgi:hypothetical protein